MDTTLGPTHSTGVQDNENRRLYTLDTRHWLMDKLLTHNGVQLKKSDEQIVSLTHTQAVKLTSHTAARKLGPTLLLHTCHAGLRHSK